MFHYILPALTVFNLMGKGSTVKEGNELYLQSLNHADLQT